MAAFLSRLAKFIVFSLCFIVMGIIIWGTAVPLQLQQNLFYALGSEGYLRTKIGEVDAYGQVDVVVLGSSHALTGFDPRIFHESGISMFNLGSASQTPIQTQIMVERYMNKLNPKIVIFEVYPGVFGADGVESALHFLANDHIGKDTMAMAFNINNLSVYSTLVYGWWRQTLTLDKYYVEERAKDGTTYISGGYVERPVTVFAGSAGDRVREWRLRTDQKEAFEKTIDKLLADGREVILVQAPITQELYRSFANNDEVDAYFSAAGPSYYNLNLLMPLSDRYFFDTNHLNQDGVEIMNRWIIDNALKR
jgi:hypothetical protein